MAKASTQLTSPPEIKRGDTVNVSSWRTSRALGRRLKDFTRELGGDETKAKNAVLNTFFLYMDAATPRQALFSVYAESQGLEPIQAIVKLAADCLSKDPELVARLLGVTGSK